MTHTLPRLKLTDPLTNELCLLARLNGNSQFKTSVVETVKGYSQNVSTCGGWTRPYFRLLQNRRKVVLVYLGPGILICRFLGHDNHTNGNSLSAICDHFVTFMCTSISKTLNRSVDNRNNYKITFILMMFRIIFINSPFSFNHRHGFYYGGPCK